MLTVVQNDLNRPTPGQLVEAFAAVPGLSAADARWAARYSRGIIVENVPDEDGRALVDALARLGLEAAAIAPAEIPGLPPAKRCNYLECGAQALVFRDALQRGTAVPWDQVALVAVGAVGVLKEHIIKQVEDVRLSNQFVERKRVVDRTERRPGTRNLLELHFRPAGTRLQLDEETMLFTSLGARRQPQRRDNFIIMVRDLTTQATQAALNRGAAAMAEGAVDPDSYLNLLTFEREIRWLLWWTSARKT